MKDKIFNVVHIIDEENIVINVGENQNIEVGDKFIIYGLSEDIFDIDTRDPLGKIELVRGNGVVVHVQEKISIVRSAEYEKEEPVTEIRRYPNSMGRLSLFGTGMQEEKIIHPARRVIRPFKEVAIGDFARKQSN